MRPVIVGIKKGGEWILNNIGPVGMWFLTFLGLVIVFSLFNVKDSIDTTREHEDVIVAAYNKRLDELKGILGVIQEEEKVRMSSDSEFTDAYKKFKANEAEWQAHVDKSLGDLSLQVASDLNADFQRRRDAVKDIIGRVDRINSERDTQFQQIIQLLKDTRPDNRSKAAQ